MKENIEHRENKKKRGKKIVDPSDLEAAKTRGFEALSRRAYSQGELVDKLVSVGFNAETSDAAAQRIEELGYLDDIAYTKMFIEIKSGGGWGRRKIIDALHRKKVTQYCIEDTLAEMEREGFDGFCAENQVEYAVRAIGRKPCETQKERDRIVRNLVSKGFSLDHAYSALNQYCSSDEEV